jgi:hypothetical protein
MALANLGGLPFRINPSQVSWTYSVDTAVIPTVGGRVVQVYGVTMGDMTIRGLFGQERTGQKRESWQLAEQFQKDISLLVQRQSAIPSAAQLSGADTTPMHPPHRFVYTDAQHNWDFTVYVKSLKDATNAGTTVEHKTGKFSYGYTLTLFIQQDNTGKLAQVAKNEFIDRLSNGMGWKRSEYNGFMTLAELDNYLKTNSSDGTIHGLVLQQFTQAGQGQIPTTGGAVPNSANNTPNQTPRGAS